MSRDSRPEISEEVPSPTPEPRERPRWGLVVALAALLLGGLVLHTTGVVTLEPDALVGWVRGAGLAGVVVLVAMFALGTLLNVPGLVFITAAVMLYGPALGFVISLAGAIASVNVTFALGRFARLGSSRVLERPFLRPLMRRLHDRPILTLTLLRALVLVSPPVNYALALTRLRHRDYAIGSALGLVLPLWVVTQGLTCFI